ncbi:MAG: hypothetical protein A2001_11850 [Treponema sp. GWC1_61_84]|nr:MAG: hypothetical protein A2001_11850 [Treponema sp. GWC1_61_84]
MRIALALVFALTVIAAAGAEEKRIALVIGNGAYPSTPLKNPPNDARDMAEALGRLGFKTTLILDADLARMNRAVRDFGNDLRDPDAVGLFYFSGHGLQIKGANYLIPAFMDIADQEEVPFQSLNVDLIYSKMENSGDKTNIVILDACRNNPFPGSERSAEKGLAVVGSQPPRSIIIFATAPGKTAQDGSGRNGTFTRYFLKYMDLPGLDIETMMRSVREDVMTETKGAQVPWNNSSLTRGGFTFLAGGAASTTETRTGALRYSLPEGVTADLTIKGAVVSIAGAGILENLPAGMLSIGAHGQDWAEDGRRVTILPDRTVIYSPAMSRAPAWLEKDFKARLAALSADAPSTEAERRSSYQAALDLKAEIDDSAQPFPELAIRAAKLVAAKAEALGKDAAKSMR